MKIFACFFPRRPWAAVVMASTLAFSCGAYVGLTDASPAARGVATPASRATTGQARATVPPVLSFQVVRTGDPADPRCRFMDGECLVPGDSAVVRLAAYAVRQESPTALGISWSQSAESGASLAELSRRHVGARMLLEADGRALQAPRLKDAIKGRAMTLSFCDAATAQAVRDWLTGETPVGEATRLNASGPCRP